MTKFGLAIIQKVLTVDMKPFDALLLYTSLRYAHWYIDNINNLIMAVFHQSGTVLVKYTVNSIKAAIYTPDDKITHAISR